MTDSQTKSPPGAEPDPAGRDRLMATWVDLTIRLGVLAILLYWSFVLIQPFITIAIWSVVLTVALYPLYERMVGWFGGRRRLAAVVLTVISLLVVIGPATWLALGLIDSLRILSERLDLAALTLPPPPEMVKGWPVIGEPIYQFWDLASNNLHAAVVKIAPQLDRSAAARSAYRGGRRHRRVEVLIAIIVAGFLFSPAPALADHRQEVSRRARVRSGAKSSSSSPSRPSGPSRAA